MRLPPIPALLAVVALATAGETAALPLAVEPYDAHLLYSGRWLRLDPAGPRCEWPASTLRCAFVGTAVNVVLRGRAENAFQVAIDGRPTAVLTLAPDRTLYAVAADLPPGRHSLELCKRVEGLGGPVQVQGLQFSAGTQLLPPPEFHRRIEFLGDSITAAYGNEGSKPEHYAFATQNAWLSWGAIAARSLEAELYCEAVSGIRLLAGGKGKAFPAVWEGTLPVTAAPAWDFARWQPDAVVVNLGTNDIRASQAAVDEQAWRDAYGILIDRIRAVYPTAHIFLAIGPMGLGRQQEIPAYNRAIAAAHAAKGDTRVHAIAIPDQKPEDGLGSDKHPTVKTHQLMAERITAAIRAELGW